jgi:hypothetical protein
MKTFKLTKSSIKLQRRIVTTLTVTLMGTTLLLQTTLKVAAAPQPTGIKNIVLVHARISVCAIPIFSAS